MLRDCTEYCIKILLSSWIALERVSKSEQKAKDDHRTIDKQG
jgi:hypothetical protein